MLKGPVKRVLFATVNVRALMSKGNEHQRFMDPPETGALLGGTMKLMAKGDEANVGPTAELKLKATKLFTGPTAA